MKKLITLSFSIICLVFITQTVQAAPQCSGNTNSYDPACWTGVTTTCTWEDVGDVHRCKAKDKRGYFCST